MVFVFLILGGAEGLENGNNSGILSVQKDYREKGKWAAVKEAIVCVL